MHVKQCMSLNTAILHRYLWHKDNVMHAGCAAYHFVMHACTILRHGSTHAYPLLADLGVELSQCWMALDVEAVCTASVSWKVGSVYDPEDVFEPFRFTVEST